MIILDSDEEAKAVILISDSEESNREKICEKTKFTIENNPINQHSDEHSPMDEHNPITEGINPTKEDNAANKIDENNEM